MHQTTAKPQKHKLNTRANLRRPTAALNYGAAWARDIWKSAID